MATLVNKVRAITGSATETSSAQVVEFLNDAAGFLVSHIPKELLRAYSSEGTVSSSTGFTYANNVVLGVRRGVYAAKQVDAKEAAWMEGASYFTPTSEFPKYYARAGKIFIKPNPTTASVGYVDYIASASLTTSTSSVFGNLEHVIIERASGYDFKALGSYYSEKGSSQIGTAVTGVGTAFTNFTSTLPADWDYAVVVTNIEDALTQAQTLIDGSVTTNNVVEWLNDEDVEMAQGVVSAAAQEINRAIHEINKIRLYIENETAERGTDLAKARAYLEEVNARMQQAQTGLSYIQKAQQMYTEGDKMLNLSVQSIELHIKNSSEMIAIQSRSA